MAHSKSKNIEHKFEETHPPARKLRLTDLLPWFMPAYDPVPVQRIEKLILEEGTFYRVTYYDPKKQKTEIQTYHENTRLLIVERTP